MTKIRDTADTAQSTANTANILARYRHEADPNSAAANRENTATGVAETGVAVIGAAIGGAPPAADSTTRIGTHIGAGAILTLTRTTAIILIGIILRTCTIMIITAIAPYQESDSSDPDPSWFPAPAQN
jgi:hypothetical protein